MKKIITMILMLCLVGSMVSCGKSKQNRLESVQKAKVLKVAVSPDYAPYEFEDPSKSGQDTYVGADIEFAKYVAKELGVSLEIVAMDFDACLAGVKQGKVDCAISALYPSKERKVTVDFSEPYFDDKEQLIVVSKEKEQKYQTAEALKGEIIAAQNGSAQATVVEKSLPESNLQLINKATDGIQMVKSGKAAGIMLQGVMAKSVVAADPSLAIAAPSFTYDESQLVIAVGKGEKELIEKMNAAIKKVNDQKLYDQWLVDAQSLSAKMK